MTRINVVPVEELTNQHLLAEYKEITRVFTLSRKAKVLPKDTPLEYTLGTGHVKFFYSRLGWCLERYIQLQHELKCRGYNINPVSEKDLTKDIDNSRMLGYSPTQKALNINQERINKRLKGDKT